MWIPSNCLIWIKTKEAKISLLWLVNRTLRNFRSGSIDLTLMYFMIDDVYISKWRLSIISVALPLHEILFTLSTCFTSCLAKYRLLYLVWFEESFGFLARKMVQKKVRSLNYRARALFSSNDIISKKYQCSKFWHVSLVHNMKICYWFDFIIISLL